MVGVMADRGRFPGPTELAGPWMRPYMFGTPIFEAKSSISSFIRKPRPSTVTPDPKVLLSVKVFATALPSESTIEKCVVCVDSCVAGGSWGGGGIKPAGR